MACQLWQKGENFMYKIIRGLAPENKSQLMPPLMRDVSEYPLRSPNDLSKFYT